MLLIDFHIVDMLSKILYSQIFLVFFLGHEISEKNLVFLVFPHLGLVFLL